MTATEFFYANAGHGYTPGVETPEQGRQNGAEQLAKAEAWLASVPHEVRWDEESYPDRSGIDHDGPLFQCVVRVKLGGGWDMQSLGGIDLGPTGNEADDYMRVVVAELAMKLMP